MRCILFLYLIADSVQTFFNVTSEGLLKVAESNEINFCFCRGGPIKGGSSRIFWGVGPYPAVAVTGLGDASTWNELDEINGAKENVRIAAAGNEIKVMSTPMHLLIKNKILIS